jgi:hypothetical protein
MKNLVCFTTKLILLSHQNQIDFSHPRAVNFGRSDTHVICIV